jgi:hypothetical protein
MTYSRDGLENFVTNLGSSVDPSANNRIVPSCEQDYFTWFANGGLAAKLINFWPSQIGTGININVGAAKPNRSSKSNAKILQEWLRSEFKRLKVLEIFIEAEIQCWVDRAAPIVINTDQSVASKEVARYALMYPIIPGTYDTITSLRILDPRYLYPDNGASMYAVDHRCVQSYQQSMEGLRLHASRILPLQGRKLVRSEETHSILEKYWGRPLMSPKLVESTLRLDAAILNLGNILHKKNFLAMAIQGFSEGFDGDNDSGSIEAFADGLTVRMELLQKISNILNVVLHDANDEINVVDRNMAGTSEAVEKMKEDVLLNCGPTIPASYLFGMIKSGGLSASNEEEQQVNATADRLFGRWEEFLNKIVEVLLGCRSCPVKNYPSSLVSVTRQPGYSPPMLEAATARKVVLEGDKIMFEMGAISPDEVRLRMTGAEFDFNIPLEERVLEVKAGGGNDLTMAR